jgi:signal transduction histidine kinase
MAALQLQYGGEGFVAIILTTAALLAYQLRHSAASRASGGAGRTQTEVAAHLHDSVLQTLALIQRSAHDPARVAQLARQQERSLRDWLAGRDGGTPATVPAALHAIAAEVEQEIAGATIDVVCVGTAAMDRRTEMLTQAAKEAMRNAARHGSPNVRVFCESDHHTVTVYVRDTGPGLRLDSIPTDRRGVRDAIIGRMDHVDGTVSIDSGDHGTEIELRLPGRQ